MIDVSAWTGSPYEGRRGCAVLVSRVLAAHGIPYPNVHRPEDALDWERVDRPLPLDVVVFNVNGRPGHVGVCIGKGRFFHVEESETARIERLNSTLRAGTVHGFYRYTPRKA